MRHIVAVIDQATKVVLNVVLIDPDQENGFQNAGEYIAAIQAAPSDPCQTPRWADGVALQTSVIPEPEWAEPGKQVSPGNLFDEVAETFTPPPDEETENP